MRSPPAQQKQRHLLGARGTGWVPRAQALTVEPGHQLGRHQRGVGAVLRYLSCSCGAVPRITVAALHISFASRRWRRGRLWRRVWRHQQPALDDGRIAGDAVLRIVLSAGEPILEIAWLHHLHQPGAARTLAGVPVCAFIRAGGRRQRRRGRWRGRGRRRRWRRRGRRQRRLRRGWRRGGEGWQLTGMLRTAMPRTGNACKKPCDPLPEPEPHL